ncbi:hypothetical protein DOTSEDRAFT_48271 [Dothistroma septosporum NZE10]|uniref:Uncharacterized protein n=1 Tax=Dothistroma septosporum (strain NZE10 / CBS 128990) TaxID=675120 RepID=M2XGX6_DOTSN|nr:hypothetical protein DOTSEDRAFT_48271 [Dothistroma septosporum NZE10]
MTIVDRITLPGTISTLTLQIPTTITSLSTVVLSGTTSIITVTAVSTLPQVTVVSVQPGQTITVQGRTMTVPGQPLPAQTSLLPGSTRLETLPGTTIVEQQPGETILYTATFYDTVYMTVTQQQPPITITAAPPMPTSTCNGTGYFSQPDGAACGGDECYLNFGLETYVHWNVTGDYPPLRTRVVFENPSASATCITTICNTTAFSEFYYRSQTDCSRPPCPSNSVNSDCQLVVGPIVLPDGSRTAVTQDGTAGWNLNLGMTGTAYSIPTCDAGNPSCAAPTRITRTTPLVYTGEVITVTPTNNVTYATPTEWLLPDLPGYFPQGDAFGQCGTVLFQDPMTQGAAPMLHRPKLHKRVLQKRIPYIGETTWPATNGLLPSTTITASAAQDNLSLPTSTAPAVTVTESVAPRVTVTATPSAQGSSPQQSEASSAGQSAGVSNPSNGGTAPGTSPNSGTTPVVVPIPVGSSNQQAPSQSQFASGQASGAQSANTQNSGSQTTQSGAGQSGGGGAAVYTTTYPAGSVVVTSNAGGPNAVVSTSVIPASTAVVTASASGVTSSRPTGSVGSSVTAGTSLTTGADGRVTAYVTVFYSMIAGPNGSASATVAMQTGEASGVGNTGLMWKVVVVGIFVNLVM